MNARSPTPHPSEPRTVDVSGLPGRLTGRTARFVGTNALFCNEADGSAPALVVLPGAHLRLANELILKIDALLGGLAHDLRESVGSECPTEFHFELTSRLIGLTSALTSILAGDSASLRQLATCAHGDRVGLWPEWLQEEVLIHGDSAPTVRTPARDTIEEAIA